jgi:bifunctional UDP-N-acetylglucosamine pyrophosphorylase/glucosamine-1-phosphate N-acetyltransferase
MAKSSKPAKSRSPSVGAGLACIVLAAGKGTRMRSAHAKVLHTLLGRPMVAYSIELARKLGASPVVAVLGHQRSVVELALEERFGQGEVKVVEQTEQRGTGHAVRLAMPALNGFRGIVIILYGDVPLLRPETVRALVASARRYNCLSLVTATLNDPTGYGRIKRDARGNIVSIVEHKDASPEELAINEINAGIYAAPVAFLREAVANLRANNAQKEYYLTDVVAHAARTIGVGAVDADFQDVSGVNDRKQLVDAEARLRSRINAKWLLHATLREPTSITIDADTVIGVDAEIAPRVVLRGKTRIGRGARIQEGCVLTNVTVGPGAVLRPYTVATDAVIGQNAKVGPFAELGPGTELGHRPNR